MCNFFWLVPGRTGGEEREGVSGKIGGDRMEEKRIICHVGRKRGERGSERRRGREGKGGRVRRRRRERKGGRGERRT